MGANTISPASSGGNSLSSAFFVVPREGLINATDTVEWHVTGAGLTAASFVGGAIPGGTLTYADGVNLNTFTFTFAPTFTFSGTMTVKITPSNPSGNTVLGSHHEFTQTLIAATSGADIISGTAGYDNLDGGKGRDFLSGFGGADNLVGGAGADTIRGGNGDDALVGLSGKDLMTGGSGADRFAFYTGDSPKGAADRIRDFHHSEHDLISFSFLAHTFKGTAGFGGTAGEIRYVTDATAGEVHGYFDANGDKKADTEIIMTGLHTLVGADFGL